MKNIVILISGRGSNMEAIVRACADERWDARIAAVVSNRADAAGLAFARERGIADRGRRTPRLPDRDAFDDALAERIERHGADIVALAGFMRILGAAFVRRFDGRLVNIHPSLLPAFPGLRDAPARDRGGLQGERRDASTSSPPSSTTGRSSRRRWCRCSPATTRRRSRRACSRRSIVLYPRAIAWLVEGRLERRDGVVRHRDGVTQLLLPNEAER